MVRSILVTVLLALVLLAALSMMGSLTASHATTSLALSVAPAPTLAPHAVVLSFLSRRPRASSVLRRSRWRSLIVSLRRITRLRLVLARSSMRIVSPTA